MAPVVRAPLCQKTAAPLRAIWRSSTRASAAPGVDVYTPTNFARSALPAPRFAGSAHALIGFFLKDRRPAAWNQWARWWGESTQAALHRRHAACVDRFGLHSNRVGSVPYSRHTEQSLVIAAGVPLIGVRQRSPHPEPAHSDASSVLEVGAATKSSSMSAAAFRRAASLCPAFRARRQRPASTAPLDLAGG